MIDRLKMQTLSLIFICLLVEKGSAQDGQISFSGSGSGDDGIPGLLQPDLNLNSSSTSGIPTGTPSVSNAVPCSPSSVGPDSCSVACGGFGYFQVPRMVPVRRCYPDDTHCLIISVTTITITDHYCNAVMCASPTSPYNGDVTITTLSLGATVTYSCNCGFELIGAVRATCTMMEGENKPTFIPAAPTCRRTRCPIPIAPFHGNVMVTGESVNNTATYSCSPGFEIVGTTMATCTEIDENSTTFLPEPPTCRPLCASPAAPSNGQVTITGNSVGDTATYSCYPNLRLVLVHGPRIATCTLLDQTTAVFVPTAPKCTFKWLPFGDTSGDDSLPVSSFARSGPRFIGSISNITIPFYGSKYDAFYVSGNGVLSFQQPLPYTASVPLPLEDDVIIAPFWDMTYYYTGTVSYRYSTEESLLQLVGAMVDDFECCFKPKLLFIVTWLRIFDFINAEDDDLVYNLYQAVVATDGERTFVLFNYVHIGWIFHSSAIIIGFNAGHSNKSFTLETGETLPLIGSTSNIGVSGIYIFRVDQEVEMHPAIVVLLKLLNGSSSAAVNESVGEVQFEIEAVAGMFLQYSLTVMVETSPGSADANLDYMSTQLNLTLSNDQPKVLFNVSVLDDLRAEINETFSVFLTVINQSESVRVKLDVSEVAVTILDNDYAEVGFEDYSLLEQEGALVEVGVELYGGFLETTVNVSYYTVPGTAQAGVDYIPTSGSLTLSGLDVVTFNVTLLDDRVLEPEKTFNVMLTISDSPANIIPGILNCSISIDDDEIMIGFETDTYIVTEGDVFQVPVIAFYEGFPHVSVNASLYTLSGTAADSALRDADYIPINTVLPATYNGSLNTSVNRVNITVVDDLDVEGNETFLVVLELINPPANVLMGIMNTTIVIIDNDELEGDLSATIITITVLSAIVALILQVVLITSAIIITYKVCVKRRVKKDEENIPVTPLQKMVVSRDLQKDVPKHLVIDSCNIQLNESVGQGEYGIVYKGRLAKGFNTAFSEVIAVKTLKGFLDEKLVAKLLQECSRMSAFDHPNVLTIIGVCLDGGPAPYLIMPFMFNGSLLSYLKKKRDSLVQQNADINTASTSSKLTNMCLQVAKGMEYLASQRVVHRDLAARNCMIDINFVIKVADFGLSETIDPSKDYFRQDNTDGMKLPVKWLAPECLSDGVFSEKSDVWAFGVTCWEVFSGGQIPYSGINPAELPHLLAIEYRLDKPRNSACSKDMFDLMTQCWSGKTQDRPAFSSVVVLLSQYLEDMSGYTVLSKRESQDTIMSPQSATLFLTTQSE